MEKNREARRSAMVTTNGLHKKRFKLTSREEEDRLELQESLRFKDRLSKRDRDRDRDRDRERERDRDLLIKNKRRRGDGFGSQHRSSRDEGGGESTEESSEEVERGGDAPAVRARIILPPNTASSSSSMTNHRSFPPPRFDRPPPVFKAAVDETIGVPVPRKARSSLAKRPHDNWTSSGSGGCGVGSEQKRRSREADSPSSSTVSDKKKLKQVVTSNRPSPQADIDIEFEVAEVLSGLKKQSSKKSETTADSIQKIDKKVSNSFAENTTSSVSSPVVTSLRTTPQTTLSEQNTTPASDGVVEGAIKFKIVEAEDSSSVIPGNKLESDQSAKTEASSKPENVSENGLRSLDAKDEQIAAKDESGSSESRKVIKSVNPKPAAESQDKGQSKDGPDSLKEELPSRTDLDLKVTNSKESTNLLARGAENQRIKKFEIDLMAPPPMPSSPERDGGNTLVSDSKPIEKVVEVKMEIFGNGRGKLESGAEKAKTMETKVDRKEISAVKQEASKLDIDSASIGNNRMQETQKYTQQQIKGAIPKADQSGQSGLLPLPIPLAGWPSSFSPLGCIPSFPTVVPIDGAAGPPRAFQPPQFVHSQPRTKRCATHQYIARNIYLHQQVSKMNQFWPAAAGSASLCGVKPNNISTMTSTGNMIVSTQSQGNVSGLNLNVLQDKGKPATNSGKDKSSEAHSEQKNQLVLQQIQQPAVAGNSLHAPAYIFPLSQHHGAASTIINQNGPSKSATSKKNASTSSNAANRVPSSSSALPTAAGSMSAQYPNVAANEAPFMAMLQNNGYPFSIPASDGSSPVLKGTAAQPLPFINGSFYSSPLFHPSQLHQQQPHPQSMGQVTQQNSSLSGGSSSSQKHTQVQIQKTAQTSGNSFFISTDMNFQQPQKQHGSFSSQSHKFEAVSSGEHVSSVDSRPTQVQKNVYGQSITVPMQPMNFTLVPTSTLVGASNGKQQQQQQQQHSQQQAIKGVELIPSQAFAMSFASFGGNTPTTLSFSSMPQNPAIFQSATNMGQQGYQAPPAAQMAHQKSISISQGKNVGESGNSESGKKATMGKTPSAAGQTLVFDNSAKTLNFMSSAITENWPSRSSTLTTLATTAPIHSNSSNSQMQLLELQKQHQLPQQPTNASRSKASTTSSSASSSINAKFPSYLPVFTHPFIQCSSVAQTSQGKNLARSSTSQVPSMPVSSGSTLKNLSQQQGKTSSVVTQISFGGSHKSPTAPHGHQMNNNQSSLPSVVESPSLRTTSGASKAPGAAQQNDNSSNTSSRKSSPVCGRNLPTVLSTCPSHISELKY